MYFKLLMLGKSVGTGTGGDLNKVAGLKNGSLRKKTSSSSSVRRRSLMADRRGRCPHPPSVFGTVPRPVQGLSKPTEEISTLGRCV